MLLQYNILYATNYTIMKRLILLFLTLMMGFGSLKVSAQATLTVADGTQSNYYVPIYGRYMDY